MPGVLIYDNEGNPHVFDGNNNSFNEDAWRAVHEGNGQNQGRRPGQGRGLDLDRSGFM